jgi:hypothetical protein
MYVFLFNVNIIIFFNQLLLHLQPDLSAFLIQSLAKGI